MAEKNAWTQALRFLRQYLKGLEDISTRYGLSNEHVALVTFGHETKVQQRLTNNYKTLRQLVENQRLGGPSPLYGGLVLALGTAGSPERHIEVVNHVTVFTKVIIITDGQLTEVGQYEGPDKATGDLSETKAKLVQCMEEYKSNHIDTYFVKVGKPSEDTRQFTDLMMAIVDGKRLDFKSGTQFSRRLYLTTKIQDPLGLIELPFSLFGNSGEDFSEEDKRMIAEIKNDARKNLLATMVSKGKQNMYREIKDSKFPPIGSRVRRGPDWKWNMQDSNGPGTVTGHDDGEQVWA
ncbi:uncharacterized protein LOC132732230 [Ruditapes philippinarum]|uniref:uncharacterized protein LOC132732230 n=1 Tax=Ruditapes philippinarum TaxID=129788 RepID=UPI00295AA39E|nr:uncharacterized protein LOC132732230 [Ruditapes philippinarum]